MNFKISAFPSENCLKLLPTRLHFYLSRTGGQSVISIPVRLEARLRVTLIFQLLDPDWHCSILWVISCAPCLTQRKAGWLVGVYLKLMSCEIDVYSPHTFLMSSYWHESVMGERCCHVDFLCNSCCVRGAPYIFLLYLLLCCDSCPGMVLNIEEASGETLSIQYVVQAYRIWSRHLSSYMGPTRK